MALAVLVLLAVCVLLNHISITGISSLSLSGSGISGISTMYYGIAITAIVISNIDIIGISCIIGIRNNTGKSICTVGTN